MRKQWAYRVTATDSDGKTCYEGKFASYDRAEACADAKLAKLPNGSVSIHSRYDGTCITRVSFHRIETRDFSAFTV